MYVEYDYEGYSDPSLTTDRDKAVKFINFNMGDGMTVDVYDTIPDEDIKLIKSYFRREEDKLIEEML